MAVFKHSFLYIVLLSIFSDEVCSQDSFENAFKNCHKNKPDFDICIMNALNAVRPYFKTGVPNWNLPPFDPFFAPEVVQNIGKPSLNYTLKLINATEAGWTQSRVITFRSDLDKNLIKYTQFFPAKFLKGMYHFSANILGTTTTNSGTWDLSLYGFVQTSTITWDTVKMNNGVDDTLLKVKINIETTRDMRLHISNLLGGHGLLEPFLDKIINTAWPPGFVVLKPLINDLVGTAFTDIFNKAFKNFPFDKLIH